MIRFVYAETASPAPAVAKSAKIARARKAMAETPSPKSNTGQSNTPTPQSNTDTKPGFDKRAYQRELMRKRRAEKQLKR